MAWMIERTSVDAVQDSHGFSPPEDNRKAALAPIFDCRKTVSPSLETSIDHAGEKLQATAHFSLQTDNLYFPNTVTQLSQEPATVYLRPHSLGLAWLDHVGEAGGSHWFPQAM